MLGHVHALGYYLTVEKNELPGTSLVVQWLKLQASSTGDPGLIPGQETRSYMMQLRVSMLRLKILHTTTETQCSQVNK